MGQTLYDKVFDRHIVKPLASGQFQVLVGLHLIHEVTSPQAFAALRSLGLRVRFPDRTFATADHAIPTTSLARPFPDPQNESQLGALDENTEEFGIRYFSPSRAEHGILHVLAPERGLTQPGMIIVCGDSHTSTHGAFGSLAFGVGTSQVRDVLATQTLPLEKLKVRRIEVNGELAHGVYAKDVALHLINALGVKAGLGYAYEYGGSLLDRFSMDERMTICNMAIEGGARCGYVNPDRVTRDYIRGREYAPAGEAWQRAVAYWDSIGSDPDADYDDVVRFRAEDIRPMVTWGVTPDQSMPIDGHVPSLDEVAEHDRPLVADAYRYMDMAPGQPIAGMPIDVAFLGSCTNARTSDFEAVARCLRGRGLKVAPTVKGLVVPGSQRVRDELVAQGLDRLFMEAGFEFRQSGCSMCLGINPDRLQGRQVCASSSNRNFKGRQGSPTGRTLLMSPVMVAAAAIKGEVTDARTFFARDDRR